MLINKKRDKENSTQPDHDYKVNGIVLPSNNQASKYGTPYKGS